MWGDARRRLAAPIGCCVAVLALAGCGGSSNSSSSESAAPTTSTSASTTNTATLGVGVGDTSAYLLGLTTVARPWQRAARTFQSDYQHAIAAQDQGLLSSALSAFIGANTAFVGRLSKLTPPAGIKPDQDDLVSKVKQLNADLTSAKGAIERSDVAALQTLNGKIAADTRALVNSASSLGQIVNTGN